MPFLINMSSKDFTQILLQLLNQKQHPQAFNYNLDNSSKLYNAFATEALYLAYTLFSES